VNLKSTKASTLLITACYNVYVRKFFCGLRNRIGFYLAKLHLLVVVKPQKYCHKAWKKTVRKYLLSCCYWIVL